MRLHGRNGAVYLSVHASDTPTFLTYLSTWSISFTFGKIDVTAITDTQRKYIAGIRDSSGGFTGFLDDASSQTYIAAEDGQPRSMILYPDVTNPGRFFSGLILPDLAVTGSTTSAVQISVNWAAAGTVTETITSGVYGGVYAALYT